MEYWGLNPGWLCPREGSCPLYYLSGLKKKLQVKYNPKMSSLNKDKSDNTTLLSKKIDKNGDCISKEEDIINDSVNDN